MMRTVSVSEMKELDRRAIEEYKIPSIVLMENAGIRSVDFIDEWCKKNNKASILILCGRGNNGGDGLVIARHLINKRYRVVTYILSPRKNLIGDPLTNLIVLENMRGVIHFSNEEGPDSSFYKAAGECDVIIDAIFGTGLDREIQEPIKTIISLSNNAGKPIISVDAPSGLQCDTGAILGIAVKAQYTVTMAVAKKGFLIGNGPECTGAVHVVDIAIPKRLLDMPSNNAE
ncbi:MAG: NAD(P)H-hydrate epimerase [Candidatus Omnitrophica bacterium]|nr:NAD(P)H-hydrate epimerase [Candidatus Omnitrophota bacterium]